LMQGHARRRRREQHMDSSPGPQARYRLFAHRRNIQAPSGCRLLSLVEGHHRQFWIMDFVFSSACRLFSPAHTAFLVPSLLFSPHDEGLQTSSPRFGFLASPFACSGLRYWWAIIDCMRAYLMLLATWSSFGQPARRSPRADSYRITHVLDAD
jgi:hypothetical protein